MQCVSPYRGSEPLCHPEAVIQEPEQLIITGGFLLRPSRLNLRLYESQLSSWWHKSFVVKGVISVINRDQSSPRTQPAHYTPLNSVHEQIRHNEAQLLHISSHITKRVPSSNNTHTTVDKNRGDIYGPEWCRSLACDRWLTPARCRRPRLVSRAGDGTSGWWCRHEEDRQGGCLWSWDKIRWHVKFYCQHDRLYM